MKWCPFIHAGLHHFPPHFLLKGYPTYGCLSSNCGEFLILGWRIRWSFSSSFFICCLFPSNLIFKKCLSVFFKHELDLVCVSGDILTVLCISAHTFQLSSILHTEYLSLCACFVFYCLKTIVSLSSVAIFALVDTIPFISPIQFNYLCFPINAKQTGYSGYSLHVCSSASHFNLIPWIILCHTNHLHVHVLLHYILKPFLWLSTFPPTW